MKKEKIIEEKFNLDEITLVSIEKYLPLYVEFFDDFIERFLPNSKINSVIKKKIGEAGEARILAGVALYCKGITSQGYTLTEKDYFSINQSFIDINKFQRSL